MNADAMINLSIVAAINDDEILARNLMRSPILESDRVELHTYYNQPSASQAYNRGLAETKSDYIAFVHQDVYLPGSWIDNLISAISELDRIDRDWAVLGSFGISEENGYVGCVWSSGLGRLLGNVLPHPLQVVSVDELVIVLRRASGCFFDPNLPDFHLYGTDIIQTARKSGRSGYVAHIPVVHNSRPVTSLGGGYTIAYKYMRRKWRQNLPIKTPVVPISGSRIPLLRARARTLLRRRKIGARSVAPNSDPRLIAEQLSFE